MKKDKKIRKRDLIKNDYYYLRDYYLNNKKKVAKDLLKSLGFFVLTISLVGTKLFYPYHAWIALAFLVLAVRKFYHGIFGYEKKFKKFNFFRLGFFLFKKHKKFVIILISILILSYVVFITMPISKNPYKGMNKDELNTLLEDDSRVALAFIDNMEIVSHELIDGDLIYKKDLTQEERIELIKKWNNFLVVMIGSEEITETHKYFNRLPFLVKPKEYSKSFLIAYSLYVKKYEHFHRLLTAVGNNDYIEKILNESNEITGQTNSYHEIMTRFYQSKILLKRNLGKVYLSFLSFFNGEFNYNENFTVLKAKADQSYSYLIKNLDKTFITGIVASQKSLEKNLFEAWFPIQKNTASLMGNLYISRRDNKFITVEQIREMQTKMEPGDVMVQRRNWYASNIGIPGFWPHAAIYTGTLVQMNEYFKEVFPLEGYDDVGDYLLNKFPKVYKMYLKNDELGYEYSVIEGKSPGIILQSIENSAHADYVGVLRPMLDKKKKLEAIFRAYENFGKPYDYNFDFDTKDTLVCSELVYDAFTSIGEQFAIKFNLSEVSGRRIVSPTDFVEKFFDELESQDRDFDFVYFLDGNEKLGKAFVKDKKEFSLSWTRPKYDWLQE